MSIFITATSTNVGKTYISGLILKTLREKNINAGYFKPVLSGIKTCKENDVEYVNRVANLDKTLKEVSSFYYKDSLSPHLAARKDGDFPSLKKIRNKYNSLKEEYDFLVVEGAGGIICPVKYEDDEKIFQIDIIKDLNLEVILVIDPVLGSINSSLLTINYLKNKGIKVRGIIVNRYEENDMVNDNLYMIREISNIPIIGIVRSGEKLLNDKIVRRIIL